MAKFDKVAHIAAEEFHVAMPRRYCKVFVYLLISCLLSALSYPIYHFASNPRGISSVLSLQNPLSRTDQKVTELMLVNHDEEDDSKPRVYMTYYTTHSRDISPGYRFNATRILLFRLLYHPKTSGLNDVVVLVTPTVPEWQIQRFSDDGATVRKVHFLAIPSFTSGRERWADGFTKLLLFNMTEYERIGELLDDDHTLMAVYLDFDVLPLRNLDFLFDIPRNDGEASLRPSAIDEPGYPYHFAASVDVGGPEHNYDNALFDTGVMIIDPSTFHFDRLLSLARQTHLYNTSFGEKGLLNYAYRRDGPYPYQRLPYVYNGQYPNGDVLPELYTIHAELWKEEVEGPEAFWRAFGQVEAYHDF